MTSKQSKAISNQENLPQVTSKITSPETDDDTPSRALREIEINTSTSESNSTPPSPSSHPRSRKKVFYGEEKLSKQGSHTLSREDEAYMVEIVETRCRHGCGIPTKELQAIAESVYDKSRKADKGPKKSLSKTWAARFLKRNTHLKLLCEQAKESEKDLEKHQNAVEEYFKNMKETFLYDSTPPSDIWSLDFNEFKFHDGPETCYIMECVSATGERLTPLVYIGGSESEEWRHALEVTLTRYNPTYQFRVREEKNCPLMLWLEQHFEVESCSSNAQAWRVLLMSDAIPKDTLFRCRCNVLKITPTYIPPRFEHLLQPLDVMPGPSLRRLLADEVKSLGGQEPITSPIRAAERIGRILHRYRSLRERLLTKQDIVHGFEQAGVVPFRPSRVMARIRQGEPIDDTDSIDDILESPPSNPILNRKQWREILTFQERLMTYLPISIDKEVIGISYNMLQDHFTAMEDELAKAKEKIGQLEQLVRRK